MELILRIAIQHHFNIVLEEDVAEFPELYGAVADSYFGKGMFNEALDVYQDMAENEDVSPGFFLGSSFQPTDEGLSWLDEWPPGLDQGRAMPSCVGRSRRCERLLRSWYVLFLFFHSHEGGAHLLFTVAEADPDNLDAKMELAKVYEQMNNPHKALAMINDSTFLFLRSVAPLFSPLIMPVT